MHLCDVYMSLCGNPPSQNQLIFKQSFLAIFEGHLYGGHGRFMVPDYGGFKAHPQASSGSIPANLSTNTY
jgi:hypothetical protein